MRGTVSSGHPLTAGAAAEMLSHGGNAFDAAVAAGFASIVSEPSLTSFGGGGFFLAHIEKKQKDILFDFFVNTPGLGHPGKVKPVMTPIDIQFPECTQVFHTGMGSAAVPGMLKGLLHIHDRLCTLPLKTILSPAVRYLEACIEVSKLQAYFMGLLTPIFTSTDYGKEIYMQNGQYIKEHDRLHNPHLKSFFNGIADGTSDIYAGDAARELIGAMKAQDGLITGEDLASYNVIEREPLCIKYRDRAIVTNPPPSSGGIMIALGLHMLEKLELSAIPLDSEEFLISLIALIKELHDFKPMKNGSRIKYPFADETTENLVRSFQNSVSEKTFLATRGTTHISVVDEEGNAASMTTSNGSGSGCFIPGTGIMLNNMMGEDDLHPDGFFASTPGQRVSSMMIPTIVLKDGKVEAVMGSGGSKRIKTAVLQVLINLIDYNCSLEEAVEKSRIHFEDGVVQIEPEITPEIAEKLNSHYNIKLWNSKNMYFGGVHCVNGSMEGWGDSRRGGSFISVK
jgi:gamma-glutamyltranspeptidase/glutathione hydrolase